MKNIFSFLSKESKNIDGSKNPKTHLKHKSSEYTKIANFHYHSKFTSMNDKIHEKVSIKSPTSLFPSNNNRKTDLEEIETFKNKDSEEFIKIELTKLDIIILSFVCFCIEFG